MPESDDRSMILLVPTKLLLLIAAAVWMAAGLGVATVGLELAEQGWAAGMAWAALAVFAVFLAMFMRLSRKNARRILGSTERLSFVLGCFDANSYLVMVLMAFLGTAVRISTFVPASILASFYCGLGAALAFAGYHLLVSYLIHWDNPRFH